MISCRAMEPAEADAVAAMVKTLGVELGGEAKITGDSLRGNIDLIDVVVAERDGTLCGVCLGLQTYSTWRGERGLYIVDLFVDPAARGLGVGEWLLQLAAKRAWAKGARFIKLEVDMTNAGAERFYFRLGFARKEPDRLFALEQADMKRMVET